MNMHFSIRSLAALVLSVTLAGALLARRMSDKVLVVNGKTTGAATLQKDGHWYVDIAALAELTNGSATFESDRILLTIPGPNARAATAQPSQGISKNFASVALAGLAEMREWKGAVETMIQFQLPASGTWIQQYQNRAEGSLTLASVAASTTSDQDAFQLLQNEYAALSDWAGSAVAARQALNATRTMNPDFLRNDPVLAKISNCGSFLSNMLVSGMFADNAACH